MAARLASSVSKMWIKVILICVFGCSSSMTTSFDLGGVLSGNRMAGVPLGRSLGEGELDVEGVCAEPGVACASCTQAVTCVPLPVGYLKVPLQTCSDGQTCNARLGQCSNESVPECQEQSLEYQHSCEQVGIFPDAYDCRKFHLCSPPEGSPFGRPADHRTALCPRHYGYNPQTAQCSIILQKGQCSEKPVPDCKYVGQNGPLSFSPNHYYVCLLKKNLLYPQVFLCPHGWFFRDGFCHPEPKTESPISPANETIEATREKVKPSTEVKEEEKDKIKDGKTNEIKDGKTNEMKYGKTNEIKDAKTNEINDEKTGENKDKQVTLSWIDTFFSTEKATTYKADAFLADRFDLTNYESTDDVAPPAYEFANSFEESEDFW